MTPIEFKEYPYIPQETMTIMEQNTFSLAVCATMSPYPTVTIETTT